MRMSGAPANPGGMMFLGRDGFGPSHVGLEARRLGGAAPPPGLLPCSWGAAGYGLGRPAAAAGSPNGGPRGGGGARCHLRKGKWTPEEEAYTERVIHDFNEGLLQVAAGTTLRSYLSEKLNCDPMRITKKYAGSSCIGKRIFAPCDRTPENLERVRQSQLELGELESAFRTKLESSRSSRMQGSVSSMQRITGPMDMSGFPMPPMSAMHNMSMGLGPGVTLSGSFSPTHMMQRSLSQGHQLMSPLGPHQHAQHAQHAHHALPAAFMRSLAEAPKPYEDPAEAAMMRPEVVQLPLPVAKPAMNAAGAARALAAPGVARTNSVNDMSKADHDACGLLMGFLNSVRQETSSNDASSSEASSAEASPKHCGRASAATPFAPPTPGAEKRSRKRPAAGALHARGPFDAAHHADDEAETSSSDYHTDNESSASGSTGAGNAQGASPLRAAGAKALGKHRPDASSSHLAPGPAKKKFRQRVDL